MRVMSNENDKREAARGQYRTTVTDWQKLAPYIRFRYERVRDKLPAEGTVFELGCGIGVGLAHLAGCRPDLRFVGVDLSEGAIEYGREHFAGLANLHLHVITDLADFEKMLLPDAFLVALEVIEHLTDEQLEFFRWHVMQKVNTVVFSFPFDERDIAGTPHLQTMDIFKIFEIFPGFETLFLRRYSLKFIGYWRREARHYLREHLKVAREAEAIARIANVEPPPSTRPADEDLAPRLEIRWQLLSPPESEQQTGPAKKKIQLSMSVGELLDQKTTRKLRKLWRSPAAFLRDSKLVRALRQGLR
jgi:SAM-dependent methyltransferase